MKKSEVRAAGSVGTPHVPERSAGQDHPVRVVHRLGSGLRLVATPMPCTRRVMVEVITRAGSRFDPEGLGGISHFLEHMLYRGTPRYPGPHELALAIEDLGGTLEAATYVDHGSIALSLPPESLLPALSILGEVVSSPILQGIDLERTIVAEEILEMLDEDGRLVEPDELGRRLAFGDHALGRPITGNVEALERFDAETLRRFHQERYRPSDMIVALAGPLDVPLLLPVVEQAFSKLVGSVEVSSVPVLPQAAPRFEFVRHADSQTAVRLAFRAAGHQGHAEPTTDLLMRVIDDGMSTRLYHRICNTLGLCYDVGAYYESWADAGIVEIAANSAPESTPRLVRELLELLRRLRDEGPTEEEVSRARRRARWQLSELYDDPGELTGMSGYGELWQTAGDPEERLSQLDTVSHADLREAAQTIFTPNGMSVVCVGELAKRSQTEISRAVLSFA